MPFALDIAIFAKRRSILLFKAIQSQGPPVQCCYTHCLLHERRFNWNERKQATVSYSAVHRRTSSLAMILCVLHHAVAFAQAFSPLLLPAAACAYTPPESSIDSKYIVLLDY